MVSKVAKGCFVLVAALLLLQGQMVQAQITTATINGTVTDATGAEIPGATVTATNTDTNFSRTVQSGPQGDYHIGFLPVGNYKVTVSAKGFQQMVRTGIVLDVNQVAQLNAQLQAGQVSQTVTVSSGAPLVNTTNAEIGRTVDNVEITTLPIVGRDVYSLLSLTPGVQHTASTNSFGFPEQHAFINGGSDNGVGSVSYYLDGGINMTSLRNTGNIVPNPDAIQEFRVETNNYGAEYGRLGSGVINVITKSGTNHLHGSLFEFFRNDKLNANDWGATSKAPLHRNQFGATLGGPIVRNKTFFFGSYGGLRQTTSQFYNAAVVPTDLERQGNFSQSAVIPVDSTTGQPFDYNGVQGWIPPDRLDSTAMAILNPTKGLPGIPVANEPSNVYQYFVPNPYNTDEFLIKVDDALTTQHELTATYYETSGSNPSQKAGNLPWSIENYTWRQHEANISDTWTLNSHMVNQLWFTYTRNFGGRINSPEKSLADYGSSFQPQGRASLPNISVSGYFTLGQAIQGPVAGMNFYAIRDVFSWSHGKHTISFGGEESLNKDVTETLLNNYGTFSFTGQETALKGSSTYKGNALADFLLGLPVNMHQDTPDNALDNSWYTGLYFQDDYRVLPRLTLNLGLRYDLQTPPTDPQDREDTFEPGVQSTVVPSAPVGMLFPGDKGVTRGVITLKKAHFSPRVGFAWDSFGNGRTSVRGGFGIFYGSIAGNLWNAQSNFQPFAVRQQFNDVKSLTDPYGDLPGGVSPFPYNYTPSSPRFITPASVEGVAKNFAWPYTYQMNLSVQRQLSNTLSVMAAYVGSIAHKLPFAQDINYPAFTSSATTKNIDSRRPYDTGVLSQIYSISSNQGSYYDALQLSVEKRMGHHFSLNSFYVFSKGIDTVNLDSTFISVVTPQDYSALWEERARSNYDQKHMFVLSGIWNVDYFHGPSALFRHVLNGWQVSPIITLHSGTPFSIGSGKDNNLDGNSTDRPNLVAGQDPRLNPNRGRIAVSNEWFNTAAFVANAPGKGIGPGGADGDSPRNFLDAPGYRDVDLGVFRNFNFADRFNLQARLEATNIFNMVSLSGPNTTLTSSLFGTIRSASGMRQLQLGMRLTF